MSPTPIDTNSFKPQAPASYFCPECGYRHNKGSIRYHDHWRFRQAETAVKKASGHGH